MINKFCYVLYSLTAKDNRIGVPTRSKWLEGGGGGGGGGGGSRQHGNFYGYTIDSSLNNETIFVAPDILAVMSMKFTNSLH